jgi:hypothetical protein
MRSPSRRSLFLFLIGAFSRLYEGAEGRLPSKAIRRPREAPFVYLCEGNHLHWAIVQPDGSYTGRVAWSNVFRPGTLVKSKKSWRFAAMKKAEGHPSTIISPRYLKVLGLPPVPEAARKGLQQPRFVPLREFSLAA